MNIDIDDRKDLIEILEQEHIRRDGKTIDECDFPCWFHKIRDVLRGN